MFKEILNILQNLGITAFVVAGIAWLLREIFKQILNKDLEKFKSSLEKETIEFKIRYEKIHGERVEVIKEFYKKLSCTYRSFNILINPMQFITNKTEEEKGREAAENANNLTSYYEENRIFFSEDLAKDIDNLLDKFKKPWAEFLSSKISKSMGDYKISSDQHTSAWKQINEEIPEVRKQLENKFRNILGIKNEN